MSDYYKPKKKSKTLIILSVIVLLALGYVCYNEIIIPYGDNKLQEGYQQGSLQIVLEQTQTGSFYFIENEEVIKEQLQQLCGRLN